VTGHGHGHGHGPAVGPRHPASGLAPLSDAREPGWSEPFAPPARREEPVEDEGPGWLTAARADAPRPFSFGHRSRRWPWALGGAVAGAAITAALTLFVLRPTPELHWTPGASLASLGGLGGASADGQTAGSAAVGSGTAAPAGTRIADGRATHAAEAARRAAAPGPLPGPAPTLNGAIGSAPTLNGPTVSSPTGTAVGAAVAGVTPGTVADPAQLASPGVAGPAPVVAAAPSPVAVSPVGGAPTSPVVGTGAAAPLAGGAPQAAPVAGVPPLAGTASPAAVMAGAASIAPQPGAALLEKTTDAGGGAGGSRISPVHASAAAGGSDRHAAGGDAREAIAAARREENELAENPAAACSPRTNFALYRCMQNQCEQRRFFTHPQCIRLRVRDEVS
jgi:hypothetical protein